MPLTTAYWGGLVLVFLPGASAEYRWGWIALSVVIGLMGGVATYYVPWHRLPNWTDAIVPLLCFPLIALLREGTGQSVSITSVLILLPLIWVALYGTRTQVVLAVLFTALFFFIPPLIFGVADYPTRDFGRGILFSIVAAVIGLAVHSLVGRERRRIAELAVLRDEQTVVAQEAQAVAAVAREQRALTQTVVGSVDVGIAAVDAQGEITFVNRAIHYLLGIPVDFPRDILLTQPIDAYEVDGVTPVPMDRNPLLRSLHGEIIRDDEAVVYRSTGQKVWISITSLPIIDDTGKITGAVASIRDFTDRVEDQRKLRHARDQLSGLIDAVTEQAVIATDRAGVVTVFNTGAQHMLGIRADEVIAVADLASWHEPEQLAARARALGMPSDAGVEVLIAGARDGESSTRPWTLVRPDGHQVETLMSITAIYDEAGLLTGYLAVISDITAQRAADRLKDEFIALVSHELRTPLSSIIGYLEVLLDDPDAERLTEEQTRYMGVIDRNARRLLRLVGDLLFTAQVEAGTVTLQRDQVSLATVLEESIAGLQPKADGAQVTLELEIDAVVPPLSVDGERIGQAVDNLLGNAVKFTPPGGEVCARLTTKDGAAVIEVSDTGMGIAPEAQSSVFDRFYRTTEVTLAAIPGIGLGLAISQAIAQAHGGRLVLASSGPDGTTFRLTLPLSTGRA